nr:hypothetical protein [Dinophyceae sp. MRD-151]
MKLIIVGTSIASNIQRRIIIYVTEQAAVELRPILNLISPRVKITLEKKLLKTICSR